MFMLDMDYNVVILLVIIQFIIILFITHYLFTNMFTVIGNMAMVKSVAKLLLESLFIPLHL
jgi:hypothetical protein